MKPHLGTFLAIAAAAAFVPTVAAALPPTAERLLLPPLRGFAVGHRFERGGNSILEQVPQGESVQRWTRMVTTQRFAGASSRLSPQALLGNMAEGLVRGCPGARASKIQSLSVSGRPAAQFRADCPRNPATGLPETFLARSVGGTQDMHIVQVAFRHLPEAKDLAWAQAHLDAARLCPVGRAAACR